jgi:hypothetical protein
LEYATWNTGKTVHVPEINEEISKVWKPNDVPPLPLSLCCTKMQRTKQIDRLIKNQRTENEPG